MRDVALLKSGDAGELAIGVAPVPASTLLPRLLVRLKRERPGIAIKLHFGNVIQLLPLLEAQQLDLCFGDPRMVPPTERFARTRIAKVYGSLYCRKGHPAIRRRKLDAEFLRSCGFGAMTIPRELLAPIAHSLGFASVESFPLTMQCDDVNLLAQVAAQTDLLVMLPDPLEAGPTLHKLRSPNARAPFADVHALWLHGRTLSAAGRFTVDAARELAA